MQKIFETPGPVQLYVENEVGLIAITASQTRSTIVSLEAATPGAEELIERAVVECRSIPSGHVVAVKVSRRTGMRFVRREAVIVRVELPEESVVKVMAGSADVEIMGAVGSVDVSTASGDISTDDVAADVTAKSGSGDVTLGTVGGDLRVHTASGDLRCSSVAGTALFATASGDVEVGAARNRVEVKGTSGSVRLGELSQGARIMNVSGDVRVLSVDRGTLHVRSVSGDVSVGVAKGVDLHVDVETMTGSVNSEIPLGDAPGSARHDGRVDLSVRSVSGNVDIARAFEQVA
jgi:DUF4097 and DUF4098 domain-containing protein YvlB